MLPLARSGNPAPVQESVLRLFSHMARSLPTITLSVPPASAKSKHPSTSLQPASLRKIIESLLCRQTPHAGITQPPTTNPECPHRHCQPDSVVHTPPSPWFSNIQARDKTIAYMEKNTLHDDNQHGFRKNRSCLSKLLAHHDWLLETLVAGNNVDVVFLDFAKAFDKVDHGVLLHKVKAMGITGKLGLWLHDFLTGRVQTVVVEGCSSTEARVNSGVPQGSVLGPLLFLIHMGDISEGVENSFLSSFADDTSISCPITSVQEVTNLQRDLDKVYEWAANNNMHFNEDKFEILRCGPDQNIKAATHLYTEGGRPITPQQNVKCLGINLSDNGSFTHHITETVQKAKGMAGWVLRTFASRDPEVMLTLWKALVQPILDYCSQLWSPHKKSDIQRLEAVQRSFTRQIIGLRDLDYWERLNKLGLYSQQRRRERYRAIYIWKILEKQVPDPTTSALQTHTSERTGRKCSRRALPSRASGRSRSLLASSLAHEGPKLFNSLSKEVRNITGCPVIKFKSGLDKQLRTVPDQPPVPGYTARCRTSNSIPDQIALQSRDARTGNSGGPPRL